MKMPTLAMLAKRKRVSFSILTGLFLGTSYIPFPPWALFFYLVPLFIVWWDEKSWRGIFWTGTLAQFTFNLIGFNWVAFTVHEFGHLPWPVALIVLFLFCLIANLYLPLMGLLWFWLDRRLAWTPMRRLWALPLLVCLGGRFSPMIFDWNEGYPWFWSGLPAYQVADVIGFLGLATITLFFNGLFFMAWHQARHRQRWWPTAALVPVLFALLNVIGLWRAGRLPQPDAHLKVLLVQANIGNQDKLLAETGGAYSDVVIDRWVKQTDLGLAAVGTPVDFVVWPETAFPETIVNPHLSFGYALKLKRAIQANHTKLITGGYGEHHGRYTNSFFVLNEYGDWMTRPYDKTILLAFGEYFPLGDELPFLKRWFPEVGDYARGPGPTVLDVNGLKIGAQICYEGLFDWFSRRLANQGAQVIVNVTNDSWYGKWEQPYQHGWMTFARAVEVRRPLVRSTNTGISSVALASGEILTLSALHEEWFHLYEVPYYTRPETTPFMGWGYWLMPAVLLAGLLWIITSRNTLRSLRR